MFPYPYHGPTVLREPTVRLRVPLLVPDELLAPPVRLGRNPPVCLDTYAPVMAEQDGGDRIGAEEQITAARRALERTDTGVQLDLFEE